ncbi:MAG: hypothetical protein HDQ88_01085, partial [Clostridia bacterium]|nr:hypothetical protein [Clostridia bacterium]
DLDEDKIYGVPLWRLVKTQFRWHVRDSRPFTVSPQINIWDLFKNYFKSFGALTRILLFNHRIKALFFPHPRLFLVDNAYLERLSDPLIDSSGITEYLIFERNQNGTHKRPRYHESKVIYLDFIDINVYILSIFFKPLFQLVYLKKINSLYTKLNETFGIDSKRYKSLFASKITEFILSRLMIAPILKKINPDVVFFSPRGTYDYAVSYCKKNGSITVELQHGIVLTDSDLYTSKSYNKEYDPDYFFVFGNSNVGEQYGMPIERVLNIGFPFKDYIKNIHKKHFAPNITLVISEPEITDKIIAILIDIIKKYPEYEFHIRCHPQEVFSEDHYSKIKKYPQIKVVENKTESFYAISQYENVMGEQSSVLFEAMSLNKKVARINYGGLKATNTEKLYGGHVISSADDYHEFMVSPYNNELDSKDVYSDFQEDTFKKVLE